MHGGFTATLVDNITTYALLSKGTTNGGVSVDLHVRYKNETNTTKLKIQKCTFFTYTTRSYIKGAKEGDEVIVDARTVRAGRNLAYLECELRKKVDGTIIAKGTQTKYVG